MIWYILSVLSYFIRGLRRRYQPIQGPAAIPNVESEQGHDLYGGSSSRFIRPFARTTHDLAPLSYYDPVKASNGKESFVSVHGSGKSIAILTSGGDSQGMNAAIRATARLGIYAGARVYAVYWGYQGLVDGGEYIKEMTWDSVSGIIHLGGTVIGSARCKDFRGREGRRKAAYNLVSRKITNLVVIGGDGSLTGANLFRQEWPELVAELVEEGKIDETAREIFGSLNIVGMVGSIDNDFCGTDMTIGADSALHRITEALDAISTTAESHQRTFVLEVMGRHCGYLALIAGIGCGADWVFIPELPAEDNWENQLCDHLKQGRKSGRLLSIIILAEGATTTRGESITSNQVKELISNRLGYDTRVTVLGHVQRGGAPSAFDRLLACRFGAEAALALLDSTKDTPSYVMCLEGNRIVKKPLTECVERCNQIKEAYEKNDYEKVISLRGGSFCRSLNAYRTLAQLRPPTVSHCNVDGTCGEGYTFAVLNVGAPAGGMNTAVRAFVRCALNRGHSVVGIRDGFDGFIKGQMDIMGWNDVDKWSGIGGTNLGTTRTLPNENMAAIAACLSQHGIQGLLIIGGFEAYLSTLQLAEARESHKSCRIPIILMPATMSNNVPGTHFSLGADTTLNVIVESCDRIRQSASSSQDRVFVVETMGGKCGYLATMAGIAIGADAAYIFEDQFDIADLQRDVQHLIYKFKNSAQKRGLVLRAEGANQRYTTDFITALLEEEAKGTFITRKNVLGHIQQGGPPSPFDRLSATRQAMLAVEFLLEKVKDNMGENGVLCADTDDSACVLGNIKTTTRFTPVSELKEVTDFKNRLPKERWWYPMRPMLRVLSRHKEQISREADH